jgi:hypothetical protein
MLLYLDFDALHLAAADKAGLATAVGELLRAHRYGHHLVVIGRNEASWLQNNLNLGAAELALLAEIAREYTQTADLLRRASRYGAIVPKPGSNSDSRRIELGLDDLKPYFLERAALLVEDIDTDGKFYTLVFQALRKVLRIGPLNWEVMHGGGDRLPAVFQSKITEKRVLCVVVDSDCEAPRSSPGAKVKQLRAIATELNWAHANVVALQCREVENLIPLDLVQRMGSAQERASAIAVLRAVAEKEQRAQVEPGDRYWLYFDIKNGVTPGSLKKLAESELAWVEKKLSMVGLKPDSATIDGFGDRVIRQLLSSNALCAELVKEIGKRSWTDTFAESFEELLWMCVGRTRKFT